MYLSANCKDPKSYGRRNGLTDDLVSGGGCGRVAAWRMLQLHKDGTGRYAFPKSVPRIRQALGPRRL